MMFEKIPKRGMFPYFDFIFYENILLITPSVFLVKFPFFTTFAQFEI
jgi:hypothetical protein